MLQALYRIDNGRTVESVGSEQVQLELGCVHAQRSHRGEEVKELFIAGEESHQNNLGDGRKRPEDSPHHELGKVFTFLTRSVSEADSHSGTSACLAQFRYLRGDFGAYDL
jgi:hypothetical protein